jgi:hypothetical protein
MTEIKTDLPGLSFVSKDDGLWIRIESSKGTTAQILLRDTGVVGKAVREWEDDQMNRLKVISENPADVF